MNAKLRCSVNVDVCTLINCRIHAVVKQGTHKTEASMGAEFGTFEHKRTLFFNMDNTIYFHSHQGSSCYSRGRAQTGARG